MRSSVIALSVPGLIASSMLVVGMELTAEDFRRVGRRPGLVAAALLGQWIALPAIAFMLLKVLPLQPAVAQGVVLVATCPSGTMANLYAYLARSNMALSVTLTAVSCLAALVTTPLGLAILQSQTDATQHLSVPLGTLAGQLILLLMLPVVSGMILRHRRPDITQRHSGALLGLSVASLAALLAFVMVQEWEQFVGALPEISTAAGLLTLLAFSSGWGIGWVSGAAATDRFALGMVFVVRNVGIATAIAVTVLGRPEFAVFATAYFLAQVPLLLAAACVFRSLRPRERSIAMEALES